MQANGHLCGGAEVWRRYKVGESFTVAGIIAQFLGATGAAGVVIADTTSFADAVGLALDTGTYSTTQGDAEGLVTVSSRPDLVIKSRVAGSATAGAALTTLSNTSADTPGLIVTDADVGTATSLYGTVWCISGANVGHSRVITTFNSAVDIRCLVPFLRDIAVGDEFLWVPYSPFGAAATYIANGNLQATTNVAEADGSISAGTGAAVSIVDLELNGTLDTYVEFILGDHIHNVYTT